MKSIFVYPVTFLAFIFIIGCVTTNPPTALERSLVRYSKPQTASQLIKGEKIEYELWYNANKWEVLDPIDSLYTDMKKEAEKLGSAANFNHVLMNVVTGDFAITQEYRFPITYESILKKIDIGKGYFINKEIRSVNGTYVLYIKYGLTVGPIKLVFLNYYLSNKTGCIRVFSYMEENLFAEREPDIMNLLNGLVDPYLEIPPPKSDDDIETKLLKLKDLMDSGLITQDDYDKKKDELLNSY
ncbi:MAG: SHOCT domain-containing protein [Desulfobacula sp.]|nr:SHOCT domain-containing protein [Desulfobacula sp.]